MLSQLCITVKHTRHSLVDNVKMTKQTKTERISEAIDLARSKLGIPSDSRLSAHYGLSRSAISQWRRNGEIGDRSARRLSSDSGLSEDWIVFGRGDKVKKETASISNGPNIKGHIPLVSSVKAGNWSDMEDVVEAGNDEDMRATTAKVSGNAFALRVDGDSMTAPYGLSIPEGMVVIVDPDVQAINGSIVIAKMEDDNMATIKKLCIDGSKKYLMPLNPRYEPQVINGNCRIIGVVVKGEIDF